MSDYSTNDPKGWCGDPSRGAALGRLRAFPRQNFTINRSASYVSRGEVTLYVFTEDGKAFSKGTPDELARQIQWVRTGERVRGGSTDGRVAW